MEPIPTSSASDDSANLRKAQKVMQKGKLSAAKLINKELRTGNGSPSLDALLEVLLDPEQPIDASETIEWCKYLIAGGHKPTEFATIGISFQYF